MSVCSFTRKKTPLTVLVLCSMAFKRKEFIDPISCFGFGSVNRGL